MPVSIPLMRYVHDTRGAWQVKVTKASEVLGKSISLVTAGVWRDGQGVRGETKHDKQQVGRVGTSVLGTPQQYRDEYITTQHNTTQHNTSKVFFFWGGG